jgi:hypothetical protein
MHNISNMKKDYNNVNYSFHCLPTIRHFFVMHTRMMSLKIAKFCEAPFTYATFIWFLACVCTIMTSQFLPDWKLLVTHVTIVWFLPSVYKFVCIEMSTLGETSIAYLASVRFFTSMNKTVYHEIFLL